MITLKTNLGRYVRINKAPNSKEFLMEAFLSPGLVSYEDVGEGVSRLDKETIDKMLPSFVGCPLVIEHTDFSKDEVLNGKKDEKGNAVKVGSVTRAWWNAETGKYDCAFTVESDEAAKKINEGWSGSCAYGVRPPLGGGGELHAMRYDNTILDGAFEHLALVPNPRYEDCTIRMNGKAARIKENSDGDKQAMFDKERAEHPSFTDEQIWTIVEDHMTKENAKVVAIDIPYRVISSIAEKKDISDAEVERMLSGKGLRSVGTGGGMATFEFNGSEQQAAQAVRAVLGTLDSVDIGMIQNASSDQKTEVDAMLKRGASDETIMKRMKEKHGMSDEQTQKLLDSILFPNGKGTVTVKNKSPEDDVVLKEVPNDRFPWKAYDKSGKLIYEGKDKSEVLIRGQEEIRYRSERNAKTVTLKNSALNLSACDDFEQRTIKQSMDRGKTLEAAAEVYINTVEGDKSQLSPELLRYAQGRGII